MVAWILGIISAGLILGGDYLLKLAAIKGEIFSYPTLGAAILYAVSAPLWALVMQDKSLTQVSIMFTALILLGLPLIDILFFRGWPSNGQWVAIALVLAAVVSSEV